MAGDELPKILIKGTNDYVILAKPTLSEKELRIIVEEGSRILENKKESRKLQLEKELNDVLQRGRDAGFRIAAISSQFGEEVRYPGIVRLEVNG